MQRVILPRHNIIIGVAILAREVRGAGIRADVDATIFQHVGHHGQSDIREDDAGEQFDFVGLHEFVGDLLALTGLQRIVLDDHLDRRAAELATLHLDGEIESIADVLTEIAART